MDYLSGITQSAAETPRILFFKGIFPVKYDVDAIFTSRVMEHLYASEGKASEYDLASSEVNTADKVPEYFTGIDEWPTRTNNKCWHCSRNYKTRPTTTVTNVENIGTMIATRMKIEGLMCSFDCAVAYIDLKAPNKKVREERQRMLLLLYKKMTGLSAVSLNKADPPTCMVQYGGNVSPDDYIKKLKHILLSVVDSAGS
jgi:hypothetical protein